jgi:hypothetical protein
MIKASEDSARDLALSSDKDGDNFTDMAYDSSKTIMRDSLLKAIEAAEAAYRDHKPIRRIWNEAIAAWDDFEVVAHGIMAKEAESLPRAEAEIRLLDFEAVMDDFRKAQKKVRKKLRYLRTKDEQDSLRPEGQCHGGIKKASDESCGPPPGHTVPGDSQTESAAQYHDGLVASKSCVPPPGRAVPACSQPEASAQYHDTLVASKSCFLPPGRAVLGEDQLEAAQYQDRLRTPSEELCMPEAAEVALLCQSGLMMTSESHPGHAVPGDSQPEAAQNLRTPSEKLCMPEAAEAAVPCQSGLMMTSESCLPPPGHAAAEEVQPEAAPEGDVRIETAEQCHGGMTKASD